MVSCLYHLAQNPEKQTKLRDEVCKYLPSKTSNLTSDSLNNMPYMRAVLKEALRMSPVLAGNARQTGRDIVLNGYQVPEGVSQSSTYFFQKFDNMFLMWFYLKKIRRR